MMIENKKDIILYIILLYYNIILYNISRQKKSEAAVNKCSLK